MVHDADDLPRQRTPNLGAGVNPQNWSGQQVTGDQSDQQQFPNQQPPPQKQHPHVVTRKTSHPGNPGRTRLGDTRYPPGTGSIPSVEEDTASLNSFKTCPSEPNLNSSSLVPRVVSDNYSSYGTLTRSPSNRSTSDAAVSTAPKTILRGNSYAADQSSPSGRLSGEPPRSPSGMPLPQLVDPSSSSPSHRLSATSMVESPAPSPTGPAPSGPSNRPVNAPNTTHIRWKENVLQ